MKTTVTLATLLALASPAAAQDQQLGARTKAMGGSYTAFEDDPVSIWLNPAGIATQPFQASIMYNTYTTYEVEADQSTVGKGAPEAGMVEPAILPSFLGVVWPIGSEEAPMAIGFAYARPYHLRYALDEFAKIGTNPNVIPNASVEQSFSRFRFAFARSFRFRKSGEAGFLSQVSLGVGLDFSYERWTFSEYKVETGGLLDTEITATDNSLSYGAGIGLLIGLYDNVESLKVNLGAAYQSPIRYDFNLHRAALPAFDMPQQLNLGLAAYLLDSMPLRLTFDVQWIDWSGTAVDPNVAGQPRFENALNFSFGGEYRVRISDSVYLYPRAGYRRLEAPWESKDNLPMIGNYKLILDTKGERFDIFTLGIGVTVATSEGKLNTFDLAGEFGGDSYNAAIGFTREF